MTPNSSRGCNSRSRHSSSTCKRPTRSVKRGNARPVSRYHSARSSWRACKSSSRAARGTSERVVRSSAPSVVGRVLPARDPPQMETTRQRRSFPYARARMASRTMCELWRACGAYAHHSSVHLSRLWLGHGRPFLGGGATICSACGHGAPTDLRVSHLWRARLAIQERAARWLIHLDL